MKTYRLLLLLLALLTGSTSIWAQYNPENPDEPDGPGTPVYTLTLQTTPAGLVRISFYRSFSPAFSSSMPSLKSGRPITP